MNTIINDFESLTNKKVQYTEPIGRGYSKIHTAGHGYLVVLKTDVYASVARGICSIYSTGVLAYYLEEDCEASEFIDLII